MGRGGYAFPLISDLRGRHLGRRGACSNAPAAFSCRPKNSIVFELVHHHLNTLFRAGASDFVTAVSARRTIEKWDIASKIAPAPTGHFVPRWWDILSQGDTITPSPATICTQCKNCPYIYIPKWLFPRWGLLNRRAPLLRFTPWLCRRRRRYDLAPLGLFWGALPDPPDPPETPTKGIRPRAEASLRSALSS